MMFTCASESQKVKKEKYLKFILTVLAEAVGEFKEMQDRTYLCNFWILFNVDLYVVHAVRVLVNDLYNIYHPAMHIYSANNLSVAEHAQTVCCALVVYVYLDF